MARNIALYPWFKLFQHLIFWQGVWFLYLQSELSAAEAVLLYALYEVFTTILEVPSGYASDRLGRRPTLVVATGCAALAAGLQAYGGSFAYFAAAQFLLGAFQALTSGTDGALLYESLAAEDRADEIEAQELRAFRFGFTGLALSALAGGAMAMWGFEWVYIATTIAFLAAVGLALLLKEPPRTGTQHSLRSDLLALRQAFNRPVLVWLMVLFLLTHVFSHLPFVFGQPFILETLDQLGIADQTPLVSGVIVSAMMGISIVASLAAPRLREKLGLGPLLLAAFTLQLAIPAAMALSGSVLIIGLLLLRMVPSSFIGPMITARIQPELPDAVRATFISIKSLAGRLLLSGSLAFAALFVGDTTQLPLATIQAVLLCYAIAGAALLLALGFTVKRASL